MQLLPHLYLFFISPQNFENTVAKILISSPELWKRHLWAIFFSSFCHQILSTFSSSVFPRPHPSILSSSTASVSLFTSAAAISCWCLERRSMLRPCLFALFTENFCLVPSAQIKPVSLSLSVSDVPNIPVRKYLAGNSRKNQTAHPWEQMHSCLQITDMTASDQIHRILFCIMAIFVSKTFYKYIS